MIAAELEAGKAINIGMSGPTPGMMDNVATGKRDLPILDITQHRPDPRTGKARSAFTKAVFQPWSRLCRIKSQPLP